MITIVLHTIIYIILFSFALILGILVKGAISLSLDKPPQTGSNRFKLDAQGQTKFQENPVTPKFREKAKYLKLSW